MTLNIQPPESEQKQAVRPKYLGIAGGAAILLALLAVGTVPRIYRDHEALAATKESPVLHPVGLRGSPSREPAYFGASSAGHLRFRCWRSCSQGTTLPANIYRNIRRQVSTL